MNSKAIVIGSMQEHAAVKANGICTCLTEAMGKGGGQIPMIVEIYEKCDNRECRRGTCGEGDTGAVL